jgi:hypothetical protein
VLAGTFTSNIPTGVLSVYVTTYDGGFGNVPVYIDSLSLTLTSGRVTPPDSDADGIPDSWETLYFGGPTNANASALAANGINTIYEIYIAGLNPTNALSVLTLSLQQVSSQKLLQWGTVSGRVYGVYWTTNLISGFQPLETNIPWTRTSFTNPAAVPCGYYKIDVRLE